MVPYLSVLISAIESYAPNPEAFLMPFAVVYPTPYFAKDFHHDFLPEVLVQLGVGVPSRRRRPLLLLPVGLGLLVEGAAAGPALVGGAQHGRGIVVALGVAVPLLLGARSTELFEHGSIMALCGYL